MWLLLACAPDPAGKPGDETEGGDSAGEDSASDNGGGSESGETGDPGGVDPLALAGEVSEAEVQRTIEDLVAFGTRYTASSGDEAAAAYLVGRLEELGLEVEERSFQAGSEVATNVLAWQDGTGEGVWVFQAHYDSTSNNPREDAPGADDNASGVAAVLEAARILRPYTLDATALYIFTAAEEQGSLGSAALVEELAGVDIRGVMAPDMIGYWPLGEHDAMDILGDEDSEALVMQMSDLADALGVAHKAWVNHDYCYGDDHTNWQEAGYPSITPMDCVEAHNVPGSGESTPHYHKTSDTIDTLHLGFTTRVVGVSVALMATWVGPR